MLVKMCVCITLFLIVVNSGTKASVQICITNCVQCKKMFGRYFHGKACGDACITTGGHFFLDCNNPKTFNSFLKRFF